MLWLRRLFLVGSVLAALIIGTTALVHAPNSTPRVDPRVNVFTHSDNPAIKQLEEHRAWTINWLNDPQRYGSEVESRVSDNLLRQVPASELNQTTKQLANQAPFQLAGSVSTTATPLPEQVSLVTSRLGKTFTVSITGSSVQPDRMEGLWLLIESDPEPPRSAVLIAVMIVALLALSASAVNGWNSGTSVTWLWFAAGTAVLGSLLILVNARLPFTIGLISLPFAAACALGAASAAPPVPQAVRWLLFGVGMGFVAELASWLCRGVDGVGGHGWVSLVDNPALSSTWFVIARIVSGTALAAITVFAIRTMVSRTAARPLTYVISVIGVALGAGIGAVLSLGSLVTAGVLSGEPIERFAVLPTGLLGIVGTLALALPLAKIIEANNERLVLQEAADLRRRLVSAEDAVRKQIERDLHDGTQHRLLAIRMTLRRIESRFGSLDPELASSLRSADEALNEALGEVRHIAQGVRPSALNLGLRTALDALAEDAPLPVDVDATDIDPLPDSVATTAWFVVAEAVTNAAKHSGAPGVQVVARRTTTTEQSNGVRALPIHLHRHDAVLLLSITDSGVGGADMTRGTGLRRLKDRVTASGGVLRVASPQAGGTTIDVALPIAEEVSQ
jgi:signal transduction histidine kinase